MRSTPMTDEENALYEELCSSIASKGYAGNAHAGLEAVRDAAINDHDRIDAFKTMLVHITTPERFPYIRNIYKTLRDRGVTNVHTVLTSAALQTTDDIQSARKCKSGELRNPWSLHGETTRDMIHYALTSGHPDLVLAVVRENNPYSLDMLMDIVDERLTIEPCLREGAL